MASVCPGTGLLGEQFTCLICGQEGLSEDNMRAHVLLEHVENNLCCPFCDLSGISSDEMNVHINAVHFTDLTSPPDEKQDYKNRKEDPDKFAEKHGGAIPKRKSKNGLKHSQSLDQSPNQSPSRKSNAMPQSQSESNINRRGKLQLFFDTINEPGPSNGTSSNAMRPSTSAHSMRQSTSSHGIRQSSSSHAMRSTSCDTFESNANGAMEVDQASAQSVRLRLQSSIHSQNNTIHEEGQDNNNVPLQPNLNQVMQPDINDNVEPDINCNMPAGFSCPLCQFITASANLIQAHVNMAHVDVLSPARATREGGLSSLSGQAMAGTSNNRMDYTSQPSTSSGFSEIPKDEYPCPICLQIFDNSGELSLHVNHAHAQIFSPDGSTQPDIAGAAQPEATAGQSVLHCPVCEMEFHDRSRLEAHVNGHFSAEQTPVQERNDKLIAQALQEKESFIASHQEKKEFDQLQAMYGMVDGTPYKKKYEQNLEKAVANGDMTPVEFHERKNGFKFAESRGIDDGTSCTKGVVQRLQEYYRTPTHGVSRAWLCTTVDHYAGSYGDKGWGCGYRNFQMLLSALMTEPNYRKMLFNDKPLMPSIPKIQRLIESAWEKGFDKPGSDQLGGRVFKTEKWIGATEIVATLASLKVRCRLLDFHNPSGPGGTHPTLFEWIKAYFQKPAVFKPPLYLQHQGHSRTVVGIEELKDKRLRLIIFDPSIRKKQMQLFHSIVNANIMRTLRKPIENLKAQQYQIVAVTGTIPEQDYQGSKVLKSERLS